MQHLLSLFDISPTDLRIILATAVLLKNRLAAGERPAVLERHVLALLFEKPSLRTRVSLKRESQQLGGTSMFLGDDVGWGKRESVSDFTKVLGQFVDAVVCRTKSHDPREQLAQTFQRRARLMQTLQPRLMADWRSHPSLSQCCTLRMSGPRAAGRRREVSAESVSISVQNEALPSTATSRGQTKTARTTR